MILQPGQYRTNRSGSPPKPTKPGRKRPYQWSKRTMLSETDVLNTIELILAREGGYVDDPDDHGGETSFGITRPFLAEYGDGTAMTVRDLTRAAAAQTYRRAFKAWHIDQISDLNTFSLVADCCVNHGEGVGIKWLQAAIGGGIAIDGVIGAATLAQLAIVPNWQVVRNRVLRSRILFYGRIITNDHSQARFAAGWMARCAEFLV
jgi:lysozyme family protein